MKKFFSLVLALVMALSLTTMAWGADTTVVDATNDTDIANALANTTTAELVINLPATTGSDVFTIEIYGRSTVNTAIKSVTINGTDKTKVQFSNLQVNVSLLEKFTIDNCEILHMATKSWGHLVFGDGMANGVYTVSNCLFNGVGTQGIYFNPKHTATYVVKDCTFTGDFGSEGAVVVQNGDGTEASSVPSSLTVSSNTFAVTNGEDVAVWFKDSDLDVTSQVPAAALVNNAEQFKAAAAAADAGETIKLMANVDLTSTPVEITNPVTIDDNGKTLTGLAAGSDITTNANGEITGGTFSDPAAAEPYLADDVILGATGTIIPVPASANIPAGGPTLAPSVDDMTVPQYASWKALLVADHSANAKKYTFATYNVEMIAKIDNAPIWWASGVEEKGEDVDFEFYGEDEFVIVDSAAAEFVIVDGTSITYLARASVYNTTGWDETAEKITVPYAVVDKYECDNFYATNPAATTFYKFAGDLYVACAKNASTIVFNVDGVAVPAKLATTEVAYKNHTFKFDSEGNTYGEKKLTKVYCGVCGANFDFVVGTTTTAVTAFGVDNYAVAGTWNNQTVYVRTGYTVPSYSSSAGSASTTTDKVESAETFDAGIAMYVGMSVMAAAGSAVVLKKKED